jgi:hypothetical protein
VKIKLEVFGETPYWDKSLFQPSKHVYTRFFNVFLNLFHFLLATVNIKLNIKLCSIDKEPLKCLLRHFSKYTKFSPKKRRWNFPFVVSSCRTSSYQKKIRRTFNIPMGIFIESFVFWLSQNRFNVNTLFFPPMSIFPKTEKHTAQKGANSKRVNLSLM